MLDQAQSKAHFSSRRQMTNNFRLFPLSFPLKLKEFKERLYVHMFDTYVFYVFLLPIHYAAS